MVTWLAPRNRSRTAPAGRAASPRSPWWRPGPPRRGAGSRRAAHRPQARPGLGSRRSSARSGVCRRSKVGNHLCPIRVLRLSLTIEVATWPNHPPVTPANVPCPAGRHWRTAAAWPRRCRRIRRIRRGRSGPGTGGDRLRSPCRLAWRSQAHRGRRRVARPTDRRVDVHCGGRRLRRDQDVVADGRQQPGQRHRGSPQGCARQRVPDPHRHAGSGGRRSDPARLDRRRRL
jgi:hypothetical protein